MLLHGDEIHELVASGHGAERSGEWNEALSQYSAALAQASERGDWPRAAEVLRAIGRLHYERGDHERAEEAFRLGLQRAEAAGMPRQVAAALNCLAVVEQFRGRVGEAEQLYRRAGAIAAANGDTMLGALVHQNLGTLATVRGDYDVALEHSQKALAAFRALGQELSAARVLNNMGMLHLDMQQYGHAELSFRSAVTLADRIGDAGLRVIIQSNRAELALCRGDFGAAHDFCDEGFRMYTKLGSESGLSETYKLYGMLYRETGNATLASTHFALALRLAQACGDRLLEAESQREHALLYMQQGRSRDALAALNSAHRIFNELQARREVLDVERKLERVEKLYLRAVEMLETEVSIRLDPATIEQYQRVAECTTGLAREAGFSGRDLTWLRIGAYLYDVGKRVVPVHVLEKNGPLDPDEWDLVKAHVVESQQVVAELDPPWDMIPMVRHHHEHWDGTGYPDGLAGEEIPLSARILCITDAYTALTSHRSFRRQLTGAQALEVMAGEAGTRFDPVLFARFRSMLEAVNVAA